jgi:hypothetical protein
MKKAIIFLVIGLLFFLIGISTKGMAFALVLSILFFLVALVIANNNLKVKPTSNRAKIIQNYPVYNQNSADDIIYSKIAGVTYKNADGLSRQTLIRNHCRVGTELALIPEDLEGHPEAIMIYVDGSNNLKLGYVTEHLAVDIKKKLSSGWTATAKITEITGGKFEDGHETYGCNIEISLYEPVNQCTKKE